MLDHDKGKPFPSQQTYKITANSSGSSGWPDIEDHIFKHDTSMIKGYADDIDTLLVFAGLFSAVLTAFVVDTFINDTVNALTSSTPFTPCSSARWINALFFTSLVFSLAAAFFGILAKQWLREYLAWNSPLSSPRDNVLVRQIRFEAWQSWNVVATIASIPALLEAAMILFLAGIVILLWTMDDAVAMTVTVVVAFFLGFAAAFTVLPIFFDRCPYKSPTAWACVTTMDTLKVIFTHYKNLPRKAARYVARTPGLRQRGLPLIGKLRIYLKAFQNEIACTEWPTRPKAWRDRDSASVNVTEIKIAGKHVNATEKALDALHKLDSYVALDGELVAPAVPQYQLSLVQKKVAKAVLLDITETTLLMRALAWVQVASQNARVDAYIQECLETIHPPHPTLSGTDRLSVSILTNWCILSALTVPGVAAPELPHVYSALAHSPAQPAGTSVGSLSIHTLRLRTGVYLKAPPTSPAQSPEHGRSRLVSARGNTQICCHTDSWILPLHDLPRKTYRMLESPYRPFLARMFCAHLRETVHLAESRPSEHGADILPTMRRVSELFAVVEGLNHRQDLQHPGERTASFDAANCILSRGKFRELAGEAMPRFCVGMFSQLLQNNDCKVLLSDEGNSLLVTEGSMTILDYNVILRYLSVTETEDAAPSTLSPADSWGMFEVTARHWLRAQDGLSLLSQLDSVHAAVWDNLLHLIDTTPPRREHATRIGADALFRSVLHEDELAQLTLLPDLGCRARELFHAMYRAARRDCDPSTEDSDSVALDGWDYAEVQHLRDEFESVHLGLQLAHQDVEACEDPACEWVAHVCDGWETCPLLQPVPEEPDINLAIQSALQNSRLRFSTLPLRVADADLEDQTEGSPSREEESGATTMVESFGV